MVDGAKKQLFKLRDEINLYADKSPISNTLRSIKVKTHMEPDTLALGMIAHIRNIFD